MTSFPNLASLRLGERNIRVGVFRSMRCPHREMCTSRANSQLEQDEGHEVRNQLPNSFSLSYLRILRDLLGENPNQLHFAFAIISDRQTVSGNSRQPVRG
jgi:hypothetical protein